MKDKRTKMKTPMKSLAVAAMLAVSVPPIATAQAKEYIRLSSDHVTPKHECTSTPCVDCTFLSYEACYKQADQAGLVERPQIRMNLNRPNLPLEMECSRQFEHDTQSHYLRGGRGQIICPVMGATPVAATPSLRAKHEPAPAMPASARRATTGVEPTEFVNGSVVSFAVPTMSCPNIDDAVQADQYDAALLAARDCRNIDPSVREWVVISSGSSRALPSRILTMTYGCVVSRERWVRVQQRSGMFAPPPSLLLKDESRCVVRKIQ
jgi:hypothetical protein